MNRDIIILGAGESGLGAALLAMSKGLDPFVSDLNVISDAVKKELTDHDIPFEEGRHSEEVVLQAREIIKSPGIPDDAELILKAKEAGIPVINELEFAFRFSTARMIAITGTNGKTTTTLLTYHLLKNAGYAVGLAGNVGHSLARQVATNEPDYYVVEVSSFQLDGMYDFKAHIGILLNITPDHLDRYNNSFEAYIDSKFRIIQNMDDQDHFIYWADDPSIGHRLTATELTATSHPLSLNNKLDRGVSIEGKEVVFKLDDEVFGIDIDCFPLIGKHNLLNTMASITAARLAGLSKEAIVDGLGTFTNAPHRLEKVATIHEVTYVNDSKATNVNAVYYALDGIGKDIIWIAGGIDKGNDYSLIKQLVQEKVKALICLGIDNTALTSFFGDKVPNIYETEDIGDAVRTAQTLASSGDTVLLSPACASFDLFKNYEQRGDMFKEEVLKLKSRNGHKKEVAI